MNARLILAAGAALVAAILPADAAGVFFSFDSQPDGEGSFTTDPTAQVGLAGEAVFAMHGTAFSANHAGGLTSDAAQNLSGITWLGVGGTGTPGHSATINPNSTGNSYSLTLPTTGLSQMMVSFNYRFAGISSASALTSFTYSVDGGTATNVPGADLTLNASSPSSSFNTWSADLSSLTQIDDQSSVTLTWSLPDFGSGNSFRMDNLQLTAVPEPSVAMLAALAGVAVGCCRRRAR